MDTTFLKARLDETLRRAIDADYKKNAAVFAEKADYEAGAALQAFATTSP